MMNTTKPVKALTEDQVTKLLNYAALDILPAYWLIYFLVNTGLRIGEAVHITWKDLIFVESSCPALTIKAEWTKTKTARTIPLSRGLLEARDNWSKVCGSAQEFWPCLDFPVLPGHRKEGYTIRRIQQIVQNIGKESLGMRVTPHMLRHTFATRLMRVADIRTVQLILGHVSITSTQIYLNPSLNDLKAAVDKI